MATAPSRFSSLNTPNHTTITADFGSSGSRVAIVQYGDNFDDYQELYKTKLHIPLSVTVNNPEAAQQYAETLFEGLPEALNTLGIAPETIPAILYGTGGMRKLPQAQQTDIYSIVKDTFIRMTNVTNVDIGTITGIEEGLYDWVGANYIRANTAVVDFGGASVEIAYATDNCGSDNVYPVTLNGNDYCVYTISQPTGNDDARAQFLGNPNCFPQGYDRNYGPMTGSDCDVTANTFLTDPTLHPLTTLQSVASQSNADRVFLLSTYYYAYDYLVADTEGLAFPFNYDAFKAATQANCESNYDPDAADTYSATYCTAGTLGYTIYDVNYISKLAPTATVVDEWPLASSNNTVSVSWTIGAGLVSLDYARLPNTTITAEVTPLTTSTTCDKASFPTDRELAVGAASALGTLALMTVAKPAYQALRQCSYALFSTPSYEEPLLDTKIENSWSA